MDGDDEGNQFLHSYLNETLPTLGLDPDTYSPYVMGCLAENMGEDEANLEDLDQIIELLQASSETHSDDESVWNDLKSETLKLHVNYLNDLKEKKNMELMDKQKAEEETRRKEIEAAKEAHREMESRKQESGTEEMSAAKKALLEQYAYDTSEQYDNDGNLIDPSTNKTGGDGNEELSNRAVAQKVNAEKTQSLRNSKGTSKKDEQKKTKNARLDKMKQKEERRNRATKGERRR